MLYDAFVIALVAFFVTSYVKYFVTFNMLPTLKLTILAVVALIATLGSQWGAAITEMVFLWLTACGIAMLIHSVHKVVHATGDSQRIATLRTRSRAR